MDLINKYLNESMQRHCSIYKAKDKKWYMELADKEYGEQEASTTYGPFDTRDSVDDYLDSFSNPGSMYVDDKGKSPVPKKSPNGRPIQTPLTRSDRLFGSFPRYMR